MACFLNNNECMRDPGVEPGLQEPESYVLSITPTARTMLL